MDLFNGNNGNEQIGIGDRNQQIASYFDRLFEPDPDYYPVDLFYYDDRAQLSYNLWRLDRGFIRYYFDPLKESFHASVTSILSDQEPEKPWLRKWQTQMGGYEEAMDFMNMRGDYGTLAHMLFTEAPKLGQLQTEKLEMAVRIFVRKNHLWFRDTRRWSDDLKNDLAGLFQWWKDYEVVPIATEVPILVPVWNPHTDRLHYIAAGTPDLVCTLNRYNYTDKTPKKDRKRVNAIIDFKTGRKGFWESHEIQANIYKDAWNWNMDNKIADKRSSRSLHCTCCANWAPTDSQGDKTTYKFKWQHTKESNEKFFNYVDNFMQDGRHEVSDVRDITGTLKLGEDTSNNVVYRPAAEFMKERWEEYQQQQEQKPQGGTKDESE